MKRNIVAKLVLVLPLMASVAAVLLPLRKASGFPSHGTPLLREAEPRAIATSDRSPVRQSLTARGPCKQSTN